MREAVALEQDFIADCLPVEGVGLSARSSRSTSTTSPTGGWRASAWSRWVPGVENPLPWLAELMDVRKEQNFFEGRVTEYQKASALALVADDEL